MKRALLVALGFASITLFLAWSWEEAGLRMAYGRFLRLTGRPILDLIGLDGVRLVNGRLRYINWIPFVGLMLVTPGLTWRRRGSGLVAGLVVLYASHLLINATHRAGARQLPLFPSLVSDALPFLLWLAAAHPVVRDWFAGSPGSALESGTKPPVVAQEEEEEGGTARTRAVEVEVETDESEPSRSDPHPRR